MIEKILSQEILERSGVDIDPIKIPEFIDSRIKENILKAALKS